jgi:hypothetical protein
LTPDFIQIVVVVVIVKDDLVNSFLSASEIFVYNIRKIKFVSIDVNTEDVNHSVDIFEHRGLGIAYEHHNSIEKIGVNSVQSDVIIRRI